MLIAQLDPERNKPNSETFEMFGYLVAQRTALLFALLTCSVQQYRGVRPDYVWYRLVPLVTNFCLALEVSQRSEPPYSALNLAHSLQIVLPRAVGLRVFLSALIFLANGGLTT